jgi:phosphatidate phosphatase APP1
VPAVGARVTVTSANGASYTATTNEAGNFYVKAGEFVPLYPMSAFVTWNAATVRMTAQVGRDVSCATCHTDPAGPTSAGHIFIPPDGVTP